VAGIIKNQLKSFEEIDFQEIATALKRASINAHVLQKPDGRNSIVVPMFDTTVTFDFSKKGGGRVDVYYSRAGLEILVLCDYRTLRTLKKGVVDYFVDSRKSAVERILSAYELYDSDGDEASLERRLGRVTKRHGANAPYFFNYAEDCLKKLIDFEAMRTPPKKIFHHGGTFFSTGRLYTKKAEALREGKNIEVGGRVCLLRVFGKKSSPDYVLYVSDLMLRPGESTPYPVAVSSKRILKDKEWWGLSDLSKVI